MKIVVDTNIVFSAILNVNSTISKLLIYPQKKIDFYSCEFLKHEITKHKSKILKITKYAASEYDEIEYLVTKNILFINHNLVGEKSITEAKELLKNIDIKDVPFYVLSKYLKAKLWTGDKILAKGLKQNGYKNIISTTELLNY